VAATLTQASLRPTRAVRSRPAVRDLARMVTGLFLFVPLAAAIFEIGRPSLMLTLSGFAALHLAVEIFLDRIGRPISEDESLRTVLVTWVAGLAFVGAAAWAGSDSGYHLEPVVVVGVATGCLIGLVCPAPLAALWGVAGTAAVAMGVAMVAPMTVAAGVAAASVAAGTYSGAIVGFALERSLEHRRRALTFEP
jgi:hypothetical protein